MIYWSTNPQAPPTFCFFHSAPPQSVKIITLDNYYDINANEINSHNSTQKRQRTQLNATQTSQDNMTERTHVHRRSCSDQQIWKVRQFCRQNPQGGFAYSTYVVFRFKLLQRKNGAAGILWRPEKLRQANVTKLKSKQEDHRRGKMAGFPNWLDKSIRRPEGRCQVKGHPLKLQ